MPTTARIITRPYRAATCCVNTRGRRIDEHTWRVWASIVAGVWLLAELLIYVIDKATLLWLAAR